MKAKEPLQSIFSLEQEITTSNLGIPLVCDKRLKIFPNMQMSNEYLYKFYETKISLYDRKFRLKNNNNRPYQKDSDTIFQIWIFPGPCLKIPIQ